jgi:PAS domain S-box-containing protein
MAGRGNPRYAAPAVFTAEFSEWDAPHGLRTTIDLAPIGLAQFDVEGRFLHVNDRLCEILGCTREELTTRRFHELTFADDLPRCTELSAQLAANQIPSYCVEKRFVRRDQSVVWSRITVSAVRNADGGVLFFIGAAENISAQVAATEALRTAEERLRTALDASMIGTFRFDVRRNVLEWADGLDRVFGPGAHVTLDEFFAVIHPDDRDQVMQAYKRSAADGSDFEEEFRVVWPDGSTHWLHDRGRITLGDDGRPAFIIGAITDITNHKRMEEVIAQREGQLRQVLGFVAHDLRNPLQAVVMAASALLDLPLAPEQQSRRAEVIKRCARDMDRLIADLLDVTRIEAGTFAVRSEDVAVPAVVSEVVERFQERAAAREIQLVADVAPDLPLIGGDAQRLAQALSNLVTNALKFTPAGGRVALIVRMTPGGVEIRVTDTGCGIAPEQLPLIFDRFWQANRGIDGAGLGLAIVKGIVESHNGTIGVESAPGQGTTFHVRLPVT